MERVEISYKTIVFTVLFLVLLWLLYQVRMIILLLFITVIFTAALAPVINWFENNKIPRGLAIFIIYIFVIAGLVGLFYAVLPPIVTQSVLFFNSLPEILAQTGLVDSFTPDVLVPNLTSVPGSVIKFILSAFSNLLAVFTVLVLTFYFLLEKKNLPYYFETLFANQESERTAKEIVFKIEKNIGGWVRGQLLLMLIVGVVSFVGFTALGLEFAAVLAVLAGILELVPNIGPTLAAIPAILIGFSISPALGIGALILSIGIQQFENHVVVPQVMKRTVGLNPIITIVALLVGFTLGGAGGAILAIPTYLTLRTIIVEIYLLKRKSS